MVQVPVSACTQDSSRDQAATSDIEGAPHSPAYCRHFLPCRSRELHCSRTAESNCSVAACGCTGCHSVHGEARSTQKGSLCRGQYACARTFRRICTPASTLPEPSPAPGWGDTKIVSMEASFVLCMITLRGRDVHPFLWIINHLPQVHQNLEQMMQHIHLSGQCLCLLQRQLSSA
jgi:hypothetical protein